MMETYTYAGDGKRRQKVTASGTTNFIWDGQNVLAEQDVNRATQAQYTHAPGIWGGLASQRRLGVSSFYGFDLAGNTRALVSPAAAITDSYGYKAFGPELPGSGGTTNPHRYCGALGYYRDTASRQYVRARHLRADVGRWMTPDPVGSLWNPYIYVRNGPTYAGDPSALEPSTGHTCRSLMADNVNQQFYLQVESAGKANQDPSAKRRRSCYQLAQDCYAEQQNLFNSCSDLSSLYACLAKCTGLGPIAGVGGELVLASQGSTRLALGARLLIPGSRNLFLSTFPKRVFSTIGNVIRLGRRVGLLNILVSGLCADGCWAAYVLQYRDCVDVFTQGIKDCDNLLQTCLDRPSVH